MLGHLSWKRLLAELIVVTAIATLLAVFVGHLGYCLFVATLLLLVWHFSQLIRLSYWLWSENRFFPPEGRGSWLPVYYGIYRMRLHQQAQRKRLASLLSYFRRGAESLPDAVLLCEADGHLLWCNRHAQHLLGFKWPEDKGQPVLNLIRLPEFVAYMKNAEYEYPITLAFPAQKFLEFRLIYPYIENNLLIVVRDVTEKHHLEKMRQNFFANVSHELRIPLTVLQGYIELLSQQKVLSDIEQKAYASMQAQVTRLNSMVTQLMTLSRIEAAPVLEFNQRVDVAELIASVAEEFQIRNTKNQTVVLNIDPKLFVLGDKEQLRQVIANLFYNAAEHNEIGCQIEVSWQSEPGDNKENAVFSVKDDGAGIAPEHLHHLTERFYRADSSRSRASGGSGLGLAIVKHALSNHHTTLQIASTAGEGSCFWFALPKA